MPLDMQTRTTLLRQSAHSFCTSFLSQTSPQEILSRYFIPSNPKITEHGPAWANSRLPFLGKTFKGRTEGGKEDDAGPINSKASGTTCNDYFSLLGKVLKFVPSADTFPPADEFIVDATTSASASALDLDSDSVSSAKKGEGAGGGSVSVKAHAKFESVETGQNWEEEFIYRLSGFDEEGRIGHWEIWADPLSAWVAIGGGEESKHAL